MCSRKQDHPACLDLEHLEAQCEFSRTKSGGPGGQHRNKVETKVIATHLQSGISAHAGERRSQHENRKVALRRLREKMAVEIRSGNIDFPTQLWISRMSNGKISCSVNHVDFPCLLVEALDCIEISQFQMSVAAQSLQCSTSQLIKFVKHSDVGFQWVNDRRKAMELGLLK